MAGIDTAPSSKRRPRQRAAFFGGIGLAAAAGCVFVLMKARAPEPPPREPTPSAPSVVAEPAPPAPVEEEKPATAPSESAVAAAAPPVEEKAAPHSKKGARAPTPKKPLGHGKQKELATVSSDPLMRIAAAPTDVANPSSAVPQKPSSGAIQAAMSQVLPKARACIRGGGEDAVSRVTLTFDASGKVQSSSLAGGASGKPAESCIKSALAKMRLPPFAEPRFSAIVTVRPP